MLPKIDRQNCGILHKLSREDNMSKLIIGMALGATCTAIITCGGTKCLKRTKKMVMNKIEDILK